MVRLQLDERQWQRIKAALGMRKRAGRPGRDDRNFVEAVLWWRRTGAPWRDLPSDFGPWKTVLNRFDRWASKGVWQRVFETLRQAPTTSGTASTARSIALISMPPEQKGALGARHRSFSWWPDNQGPLGRRRSGFAVGLRNHRGPAAR